MQPERHREVPEIETERLVLRMLRWSDLAAIFAYAHDPDVARHTLWEPHQTTRDSQAFLEFAFEQSRIGSMYVWGITLKGDDRVIGTIGLANRAVQHARAELGFALARPCWNRGITTEAAKAVLRFGFEQLRLNRIEAFCKPANLASARVLEKAGMSLEGVLRRHQYIKGHFEDLRLYAILAKEAV